MVQSVGLSTQVGIARALFDGFFYSRLEISSGTTRILASQLQNPRAVCLPCSLHCASLRLRMLMVQVAAELAQMVSSLPCLQTLELTFASAGILDTLRASNVVQVGLETTSGMSSRALHDLPSICVYDFHPRRLSARARCRCIDEVQITVQFIIVCGVTQMHVALHIGVT